MGRRENTWRSTRWVPVGHDHCSEPGVLGRCSMRGTAAQSSGRPGAPLIIGGSPVQEPAIKFTRETSEANLVSAWERGGVRVGEEWIRSNLILSAEEVLRDWAAADPAALQLADLEPAMALDPQLIIVGTGASLKLPDVDLMTEVAARGIGLEIMDTPAACRTYNVLVHERRAVVAALFMTE